MEITKHTERGKSTVQSNNESSLMFDGQPGRTAIANGKEYIFFSGYAYLGMHQCESFMKLVQQGTEKFGWSFPSSRISNTRLKLFDEFEQRLSHITSFEETIAVSNGYTAGRMAVQLFSHKANFLVAPNAHPAVSEGLPKYKGSFENWKKFVVTSLNETDTYTSPVIITDSVIPLTGQVNDLSFLQYIEKKCVCIIDDSHGIGLIGKNGSGISGSLPKNPNIDYLLVYSLSKAFNLNGGAISTNNTAFADRLRSLPVYTGATSMSPALMFAFNEAEELYTQQRNRLTENIQYFEKLAAGKTFFSHPSPELPIFILCAEVDENQLAEDGIIISSFPYPDPGGKKIQRIVINAQHTKSDLNAVAGALEKLVAR